jgi:hypothetical protein
MAQQYVFGAGKLTAIPKLDGSGAAVANPTPVQVGVLQDVSADISFETKMLYGELQFPVAIGRGKGKIALKAKSGQIDGKVLGSLLLGVNPSTVRRSGVYQSPQTVPTTPFQITIAPPNTGTFLEDLGVVDAATGAQLTRVASAPATGQYSISGAVYTFAAADTGKALLISYSYTTATGGETFTAQNALMGTGPEMSLTVHAPYQGKILQVEFPRVTCSKLSIPLKNDDFMISDLDFEAFADASGVPMRISQS